MTYTAGWNMPGYLPDGDPQQFDSFDEAKCYIIDELKFQEEHNSDAHGNWQEADAETYCHRAEDVNLESGPFCTEVMPCGYVYWVSKDD